MVSHLRRITRALLSVSDKTGLVDFAKSLAGYGVELISTGGTAQVLRDAGLKVLDVSEVTGFPEMMDGRVKTLHPKLHGGLLAIRSNKEHAAAMEKFAIKPIDLVVVNLYPFEASVAKGATYNDCIENIDIGGPAMIRAAAKNHADVTVVVEPADYSKVLGELAQHSGMTTLELRRRLAAKAYARTAAYDAAISNWFRDALRDTAPDYCVFGGKLLQSLRYGENPHQTAAFYRAPGERFGVAVLNNLLGGGMSSRLFQKIREKQGLAYAVFSELTPYSDTGMLSVYAGTGKETLGKVLDLTIAEFRAMKESPVTQEELLRAKNHLKGSLMLSLESTSSRMSNLARQELYFHRFSSLDEILASIEAVTREEVQTLAQEFFKPEQIAATVLGPINGFTLNRDRLAC